MMQQHQICRFCLYENSDYGERPLLNLYQNYNCEAIRKKIENCLNIKLNSNDPIPPIICQCCADKINYFFDFIKLTLKSENQLSKLYGVDRRDSYSSQDSIHWMSEEKIKTGKTVSDYSISLKEEKQPKTLDEIKSRKSSVSLAAATKKEKDGDPKLKKCEAWNNRSEIYRKVMTNKQNRVHLEAKKRVQCRICKVKVSEKKLHNHLQKHSEHNKSIPVHLFKCSLAGKPPRKKFVCKFCQKQFHSENRLHSHIKKIHESLKIRFSANKKKQCGKKTFKIPDAGAKSRKFKCKFCGVQFPAIKILHEHMSTHDQCQKKKCPKCYKKFLFKNHFDKHVIQCFYNSKQQRLTRTSSLPLL